MDEHYWSDTTDNPARRAWTELTFEMLCKDHIPQIKHKPGISGVFLKNQYGTYSEKKKKELPAPGLIS